MYVFNHSINSKLSKSIEPIILENSLPSLLKSIEVGTPLKESVLAKVIGASKYGSKCSIFNSWKKSLIFFKLSLRGVPTSVLFNVNGKEFARIIGSIDFDNLKFIEWLKNYN